MNQDQKEGLAIFINAFLKLNERRKGLSEIEKKAQGNIAECRKRIEEVKLKKKKVPFFSTTTGAAVVNYEATKRRGRRKATEKPLARSTAVSKSTLVTKSRKRASDDDILVEQPLSKIRKEQTILKDEEKENTVVNHQNGSSKSTIVNGSNASIKPSTNEDKVECNNTDNLKEQNNMTKKKNTTKYDSIVSPVSSRNVTMVPTVQSEEKIDLDTGREEDSTIKSRPNTRNSKLKSSSDPQDIITSLSNENEVESKDKACLEEKTDGMEESLPLKENNTKGSPNPTTSVSKMSPVLSTGENKDEEEDRTTKISQNNYSKLSTGNKTYDKIEPVSDEVDSKNKRNKVEDTIDKQKSSPVKESIIESNFVPPAIKLTKPSQTFMCSSDEELTVQKRFTRSKATKKKENKVAPNSSENTSSNEESPVKPELMQSEIVKEKPITPPENNVCTASEETPVIQSRVTRSKMARPKDQPVSNLNSISSPPTSKQPSPAPELRMTRSKMKKKETKGSDYRSGEESDTKSDLNSCSDGETGKRTVKEMVKLLNGKHAMVLISPVKLTKDPEKENQHAGILRMLSKKEKRTPSIERKYLITKTTPLQMRNGYVTPSKKPVPIINSATRNKTIIDDAEKRKKEEETRRKRQKEEEALRKKQDIMKSKQEELKKKHEEKMLKAAAMRVAAEKEKTEFILKQEKEREERERAAKAEIERKKMEEILKKRVANQTKAAEVETRRLKEEAARLARLKEMEEEQRQQEELRQKQQEENERILKQRTEELRAKEALKHKALLQKELLKKQKTNMVPIKDKDNYSITGDLAADEDDDEDDEESSKKEYPTWARREERLLPSRIQVYYPIKRVMTFFCCPSSSPDLTEIFGKMTMKRIRSSSAVWLDSPPLKVYHAVANQL